MINPYASAFKKRDDEDYEIRTPSQEASIQEKQKNNPYASAFTKKKQDTFVPVEQPKPQEEPKKNFLQKSGDAIKKTVSRVSESISKKKDVGLKVSNQEPLKNSLPRLPQQPIKTGPSLYDLTSGKQSTSAQLTPSAKKTILENQIKRSKEVNLVNAIKAMFGRGDEQLQRDYEVGLSQTYDEQVKIRPTKEGKTESASKYGATAGAVDTIASLQTGVGQIISSAGQVAKWQGKDGLGDKLIAQGGEWYDKGIDTSEFKDGWEWKDAYNPRFYTTQIAQGVPFMYAMLPLSIIGGGAGASVAGVLGLSATKTLILSSISGGFLSANAEAAFEAGGTYDEMFQEAIASGKSEVEARQIANKAANKSYGGNVAMLTVSNSLQFLPFLKGTLGMTTVDDKIEKSIVSKLFKSSLITAGEYFSEASEELGQYNIDLFSREKSLDFTSPIAQQQFHIGGISGLVFGAGGAIIELASGKDVTQDVIRNGQEQSKQVINEIEEELKNQIPEYNTAVEQGKSEEEKSKVLEKNEDVAKKIVKDIIIKKTIEEQQAKELVKEDQPTEEGKNPTDTTAGGKITQVDKPVPVGKELKGKLDGAIDNYVKDGGVFTNPKGKPVETPALLELAKVAKDPKVIKITQEQIQTIPKNEDGSITLYRGGNTSDNVIGENPDRLVSAAYTRESAENFVSDSPTDQRTIMEFTVQPEDIAVYIGGTEAEVLVPGSSVVKKEEKTPEVKSAKPEEEERSYKVTKAEIIPTKKGGVEARVISEKTVTSKESIIKEKDQDDTDKTPAIRPKRVSDPIEVQQPDDREQDPVPNENPGDDQATVPSEPRAGLERVGKVGRADLNIRAVSILEQNNYSINPKDYNQDQLDILKQYSGAGGKESTGATGKGLLSEYYTPQEVTTKLWSIVNTLLPDINTLGKKALEPSIGVGSLLEGRPENLYFTGYEYQKVSGTIASILNQSARIIIGSGQEFGNPGNFEKAPHKPEYDLVLGNPPFGDRASFEKGKGEEPNIGRWEEYFIKRGLDSLKPGGRLVYVVNSSFLKKTNTKGKVEIAKVGKLEAAYRLPEGIFADTSIGTDIVVFKKESTGDWQQRAAELMSDWYFDVHSDNIMGTVEERTNKFGQQETYVKGTIEDIERINPVSEKEETVETIVEKEKQPQASKEVKINKDAMYIFLAKTGFTKVKGKNIDIVDGVDTFIRKEGKDWTVTEGKTGMFLTEGRTQVEAIEAAKRKLVEKKDQLAEVIDKSIKKHGLSPRYVESTVKVSEKPTASKTKGEPSYASKTIKHIKKESKSDKLPAIINPDKTTVAVVKSQTMFGGLQATDPTELKVLSDTKVDGSVDYRAEAKDLLNYEDGKYYHNLNYFSGDIYEKIDQLENDKATIIKDLGQAQYNKQRSGLEAVKPKTLKIADITFDPMDRFVTAIVIQKAENDNQSDKKLVSGFIEYVRQSRLPMSYGVDVWDISRYITGARTARGKKDVMGDIKADTSRLFNYYIRNILDKDVQNKIVTKYNREKNSYVNPDYTKFPVQIENMAQYFRKKEFNLSHTQASGVSMLTNKGVGLVAYGVGVGKTHTILTATMVAKQRGWTKRPVFVVPKSTIANTWIGTIKSMFPKETVVNLGGLAEPDVKRLTKERGSDPKKWVKDGEISVLSHEGLLRLGLSPEQLSAAMTDLDDALSTEGQSERSAAKQQEKLTEIIGKAQSKAGNVALSDLGFDHLSVDEVHNFRKIFQGAKPEALNADGTVDKSQTKRFGNIRIGGTPSKIAQQLFLISQHILRNNGDRGVFLASATPFENHATEVYNILSLVARNRMRKMGIQNINDFYATFSNFETSLEKKVNGEFKDTEVMKSFKNLGELQRLIREFIDYKEDPALLRPEKRVSTPILQMSGPQIENLERIQEMLVPSEGKAEDGAVLKAVMYSVRNSISPYFVEEYYPDRVSQEELIENSPKLKYSMELLRELKSKTNTKNYGNFLYLGDNGRDYHHDIANYAITHLGYKPSEVAVINGLTDPDDREVIKEKFRSGDIILLIGGSPTKEGIDLQDNGYTTINVALGWNPTEMAQVEGRVWRQGNKRNIAPIIYPLVENSGDIFVYSKYEEKAGRINDIFSYAGRVFDVGELDPKEKKLALMTKPEDKAKLEIEIDKAGLEIKSMMLSTDAIALERMESKIESLESSIQSSEDRIKSGETSWGTKLTDEQMKEYKKELSKAKRDLKNQQDKLSEQEITDIPEAVGALKKQKEAVDIEIGKLEETYKERLAKFQKEYDTMIANRKTIADHVAVFSADNTDLYEQTQEELDTKKADLLKQIDQDNILKQAKYVAPTGDSDVGGYADIEPTGRSATALQPIQFPELVTMVKELTGSAPTLKAFKTKLGDMKSNATEAGIRLNPSIFNDPVVAAKVLSHEIGHLADWIPDGFMTRGNLLGRIASLNKYMYGSFGELNNKDIKRELKNLSQLWKPFNEQLSPKFTSYRYGSRELYADAVSVLLNDPALLQEQAPQFYNAFFEYIDKKPEFQKTYFDLMEEINKGEEYLMDKRLEQMYSGFGKAKAKRIEIEEKSKVKKQKSFWERLIRNHVSKADPIFRKLKKVNVGVVESEAQHVRETLEEYRMRRNDIYLFLDKMKTEINQPLEDIGMTEDDFGAVLTLEREAFGDRIDMANPGGLIGNIPEAQLKHFYSKKKLSEEQVVVFEQIKQRFHDLIFQESKRASENGNYSKEMFKEKIEPNKDTYATFAIVHYIEKNYIGADIKKMVGTMSEHENPYVSTLLKTISLIEWNNTQEAKSLSIEKNMQYFPDDVTKAEPKKDGTGRTIGFRKIEGREVLERMEDGKRVGYNVDPYIKTFFDNDFTTADEKHQLVKMASSYNSVFKKIVTAWSVAFAFFTNPVKDIKSTYVKFGASLNKFAAGKKQLGIIELLSEWVKAIPDSVKISKGEMNAIYKEMLEDKAISTRTWVQFDENSNANEMDIDFLLRKYNVVGSSPDKTTLLRKVMTNTIGRLLNGIEFAGGVFEANSKVAAYRIAKQRGVDGKRAGFLVRNYAGTPNYTDGGAHKQIDNDVFVFSNVMIQATRTSIELATDPKTASGYWFRTFNVSILPKIIMAMAIGGLFGEKIKDMFEKMTEYDKSFFTTIPLGYDENGKVIYFRIPGEQIDNLIGGIAWKGLSALAQGQVVKPEQLVSPMVAFVPDTTPLFTQVGDWLGYAQGRNPYDSYRGRLAIEDTSWRAGGLTRLSKMVQYSISQNGLATFKTYDSGSQSTTEVTLERIPIINRMIKTSDYGIQEKYSSGNDQEAARKLIFKRELVGKYVKQSRSVEDENQLTDMRKEMVREYFGTSSLTKDQAQEANKLISKFNIDRERGESPYSDKLINSNTNAEKVDYLMQFREQMNTDEFKTFVNANHDLKIISDDVVIKLKEAIKKKPKN